MLAPSKLPTGYADWNARLGAPFGHDVWFDDRLKKVLPWRYQVWARGPFSIQRNNTIRKFEYPWAYDIAGVEPGMTVVELGGGLSGFQFVLSREGCNVINVDPGQEAKGVGWTCDQESMRYLNRIFRTSVELRNTTIDQAGIASDSVDLAFSISALEHFLEQERRQAIESVFDALKPGGKLILTIDLFLNLAPFTTRTENKWGNNINIRELVRYAPFELGFGETSQLLGFEEFDPDRVLSNLSDFLIGDYPALAQCLVLRKPGVTG